MAPSFPSLNWSAIRGQFLNCHCSYKVYTLLSLHDRKAEGKINGTFLSLRTLAGYKEAGTILNRNQWWWSTFISPLQFPFGVMGPKGAAVTFVKNLESLASLCRLARNVQKLTYIQCNASLQGDLLARTVLFSVTG